MPGPTWEERKQNTLKPIHKVADEWYKIICVVLQNDHAHLYKFCRQDPVRNQLGSHSSGLGMSLYIDGNICCFYTRTLNKNIHNHSS